MSLRIDFPGKLKAWLEDCRFSGETVADKLKIGSSTDYTEIGADGSIIHHGAATVFDDIVQSISAANLYTTPGSVDFDFDQQWVVMQPGGLIANAADRIFVNYQVPHAALTASLVKLHFHWSQSNNTSRTITGEYRIQDNGKATTTAWTPFTATLTEAEDNVYSTADWDYGTNGNFNQVSRLVSIPTTGLNISALIQLRFTRSDANVGADVYIVSSDGHIEKDSDGSRQEYIK